MKKILPVLIYLLIRVLYSTYRFRYVGLSNKKEALKKSPNSSYLFSTWHHTIVPNILSHWGHNHCILYSKSKDGELIKFTADRIGYTSIRGSSKKGGKEAAKEMVSALKSGKSAAITPDGPKGPAKTLKKGVIYMAKDSGSPIIPMAAAIQSFYQFNSWDLCKLPLPFSKILISFGKPIFISDEENFNLEESLIIVTKKMNENESFVNKSLKNWRGFSKKHS